MSATTDMMQRQFDSLRQKRVDILAKSAPLREQRDRIKSEALDKARALDAQIKVIEEELPEIDMDLGKLARGLGGKSMNAKPAQAK